MPVFNNSRKNVVRLTFVVMFGIILLRLFTLQIISSKYKALADDQGKFRKVVYPNRGLVYDRTGKVILQNTTIYYLMVIPGKIKGIDTQALCNALNIDTTQFNKKIGLLKPKIFYPTRKFSYCKFVSNISAKLKKFRAV